MNKNFVSRKQLSKLPSRIHKAEETEASHELYRYLWDLFEKKNFKPLKIMIVGAGGSYPAALNAAHSIRDEMRTPNVEVATPQTALRIIKQFDNIIGCEYCPKYDVVIGISYSGKTHDIDMVSYICQIKKMPFVLLTGADKKDLENIYNESNTLKIISYFNSEDTSGKEKGVISMASTLIPVVIFDDYVISTDKTRRNFDIYKDDLRDGRQFVSKLNIPEIAASIKAHPVVHVFYEWSTLPTAMDIESKFVESGIANVVLHEKKNFSHGRTTLLYTQSFGLVIDLIKYNAAFSLTDKPQVFMLYQTDYDEYLANFLKKVCEDKKSHYLVLGNSLIMPAQWNIKEMSKLPYFITSIGEEIGVDISKPLTPYPKEATALYNYKDEF